jgi:hypothetical protein
MKLWSHRNLSMEGKALIAKTFGIFQIIYNMQSYPFDKGEIVSAERALFNFLWSTSKNNRGIDRIKRSILKNDYSEGGLKITDIECLNRSLKLRQFIRAFDSKHEIAKIQSLLSEKGRNRIEYEYSNVSEDEDICKSAQNTINEITDYNRKAYCTEEFEDDPLVVEEISSTDLNTYLSRKKKVFHVCMLKNITKLGIRSVGELIREYEVEINENTSKMMKMILCILPTKLIELAEKFQEDTNSEREDCQFVRLEKNTWKSIKTVTTKDLQHLLKKVLNKLETADFCTKHNIDDFDKENTILFRQNCRNPKLRNIYFRLIHGDFYTYKKMKRYKMVDSENCPRCGNIEDLKHLVFDCSHVSKMWNHYNELVTQFNSKNSKVLCFMDVFKVPDTAAITLIKIKLIQSMIQKERPINWSIDKFKEIIREVILLERYNSTVNRSLNEFDNKWREIILKIS